MGREVVAGEAVYRDIWDSKHARLILYAKEIGGGRAGPGEAGRPGTADSKHARLILYVKEIGVPPLALVPRCPR